MIVPSKFIPLKSSIIGKLPILCNKKGERSIFEAYSETSTHFDGIDEFIYALDVLYVLGKVDIDFSTGVLNVS